jgi:hypothetical protein
MSEELLLSEPLTCHYRIPYEDLGLTRDDVARGMGYTAGADATPFADDLEALVQQAGQYAGVEGGFRVFPPGSVLLERDSISVDGLHFDTGRIIAGPLRGAQALALFAVTAGPGITQWSQEYMRAKEHLHAYFVDALGSELVEKGADWIEARIVDWAEGLGEHTTNRYSPGYCGWSVSEQHKFFSLLPEGFCGIALTESALMQPEKSVSGIIGIGGKAKKRAYGCSICTLENCFRRNNRRE